MRFRTGPRPTKKLALAAVWLGATQALSPGVVHAAPPGAGSSAAPAALTAAPSAASGEHVSRETAAPATPPKPAEPPPTNRAAAAQPVAWKRWPLFDPFASAREVVWFGGPASFRVVDRVTPFHGVALGRGETVRETRGAWWLSVHRDWELRLYSHWTIVPIYRYLYEGGLRIAGIELGAGPSLVPLTLDFSDGKFSFGGLSPGATARVGFKSGGLRISVRVEREYLWRWVGQPSAVMTGLIFEIAGEEPPTLRRGSHPIVFVK